MALILALLSLCGDYDPSAARTAAVIVFPSSATTPTEESGAVDGKYPIRHALYASRDFGRTWSPIPGLPADLQVAFLEPWGRRLVIATENRGLWIGDPVRGEWAIGGSLPSAKVTALHVAGSDLYVGIHRMGIFTSADGGRSWRSLNDGLADRRVRAILNTEEGLWVGTDTGIFFRRVQGTAWMKPFEGAQVISLQRSGRRIVAGASHGTLLSADAGRHWRWIHQEGAAHNTAILDGRIVLMNISGDLLASEDAGRSWSALSYGPRERSYVYEIAGARNRMVASNNYGIHRSEDGGRSWRHVHATEDLVFIDLVTMDGVLYGGTRTWKEYRPKTR